MLRRLCTASLERGFKRMRKAVMAARYAYYSRKVTGPPIVMLRLAAVENFNNDVLRGMHRREPALDIVRVQDADYPELRILRFLNGLLKKGVFCLPTM